jgi:signal transduction histidine kinase
MNFDAINNGMQIELMRKLKGLEIVANSLPDMLAVFDLSTKIMIYSNQDSFLAEGFDQKKLQQMEPVSRTAAYIHPDDIVGYEAYFSTLKTLKTSDLATFEYRAKNEYGEWLWFLARGKVFHTDTDGVVQNITARKMAEQSVVEKNFELQKKNEELAAFAFIASHDLREPLRKINTFSSWLIEKESEQLTEQGKIYLKRMQNSVLRMDLLISDVLTLLRLQDKELELENVDLNVLLKRTQEELEQQLKESGVIISCTGLPVIRGYSSALHYIFLNLIGNGIKFRKKDSEPVISITFKTVWGTETGFNDAALHKQYVEICFADNGIGFEAQYSKIIFQMFQRLHGKNEYPGTGIGLAICKKVMDNHEGFIRAEATPGKGASFFCYFPVI